MSQETLKSAEIPPVKLAEAVKGKPEEALETSLRNLDKFVNGGGTGSIELAASEWAVTEIGAGSGFYAPVPFDHFRSFRPRPAAMFALPVTRTSGINVEVRGAERALPEARPDRLRCIWGFAPLRPEVHVSCLWSGSNR